MEVIELNNNNNNHTGSNEQYLRELTKTFTGIEKPLKNSKDVICMNDLIEELHRVFSSDHVNIEYVNHLMLSYKSNPADWKKFAKFDRYRYTRNLVDAGNGKFNLMIVCWGEGHGSAIHDHAGTHCFMKMLQGELREIRYGWPTVVDEVDNCESADISFQPDVIGEYNSEELQEISRGTMELDSVRYINDNLGLHRVENASHTDAAVSLHLYCPPYSSCSIFNQKTGKQTKCNVTFYSQFGKRKDMETYIITPEDN